MRYVQITKACRERFRTILLPRPRGEPYDLHEAAEHHPATKYKL